MHYAVLGSVEARRDDDVVVAIGGPQQRRLLARLLSQPNQAVSVPRLIDCLWPDGLAPDGAGRSVKTYVSRLRSAIGEQDITTVDEGYRLELNGSTIDSLVLESLLAEAGTAEPGQAVVLYDRALQMWRGPAYGEFGNEWWLLGEANRLNELRVVTIEERAEALQSIGHHHRVIPELERLIVDQPLRERPASLLMQALYATGRHAEALRVFQAFRANLVDETGLDPSDELVALERSMAAGKPAPAAGQRARLLRGYSVHGTLGEGAFGRVFAATQPGTNREVAIKAIRPEFSNSADFIQRFEAEAQLVARLEHPHIVPLHDYWREPSGAYLVFRLLLGGTAHGAMISDGPFSVSRVSRLIEEVGTALLSAHTAGIVHCDIKPSNVMFDESCNAYLTDFGIAVRSAVVDDSGDRTRAYAAPELAGRTGDTVQSDIFSFGCMLWELLTAKSPLTLMGQGDRFRLPSLAGLIPERSAQIDAVLARATAANAESRYSSMAELIVGWRQAVDRPEGVLTPIQTPTEMPHDSSRRRAVRSLSAEVSAAINPYKGLRAFGEADAADFFGRDDVAAELHETLSARGFVAVVGPSGSGKSSLVFAGLVPMLRRGGDRVAMMVPGDEPTASLRQALQQVLATDSVWSDPDDLLAEAAAEQGGGIVLIVDQFEECWTLADGVERERFLATLANANRFGIRCVVTIRADLYDRPLVHGLIGQLVADATFALLPLSPRALEDAITRPAERHGVMFDDGVISAIVAEASAQPASLPLLQFAMAELYERREDNCVTMTALTQLGGLGGAIGRRAEDVYASLDYGQQLHARQLFGRLVAPGQGSPDTRRRARLGEMSNVDAQVADLFVRARLLVADRDQFSREPVVEVAHEALLTSWPRLRGWLEADRAWIAQLQHLAAAEREWQEAGRAEGELYRGSRLEALIEALSEHGGQLTRSELEFIDASRTARDAGREIERRRTRRLRRLLVATGCLLIGALVAGLVALTQRQHARGAATRAVAAKHDAEIEALVGRAAAIRNSHLDTAALLAVEAYRLADTPRTRSALLSTFTSDDGYLGSRQIPNGFGGRMGLVVMPDGKTTFVSEKDHRIRPYDLDTGEIGEPWEAVPGVNASTVWYSHYVPTADGTLLAQLGWNSTGTKSEVVVWDVASRRPIAGPLTTPFAVDAAIFSPDMSRLYVTGGRDGDLIAYSIPAGTLLGTYDNVTAPEDSAFVATTAGLAFVADGSLAVGSVAGPIHLLDPVTLRQVRTIDAPRGTTERLIAFNGGKSLLGSGVAGRARIDLDGGVHALRWTSGLSDVANLGDGICALAEKLGKVFCGTTAGRLQELDLASGAVVHELRVPNPAQIYLAKDQTELVMSEDAAPVVTRWRLDGTDKIRRHLGVDNGPSQYSYDGRRLLTEDGRSRFADPVDWSIWDTSTGEQVITSIKPTQSPQWTADGSLSVFADLDTEPKLEILDPHTGHIGTSTISFDHEPDSAWATATRSWMFLIDPNNPDRGGDLWTIDNATNTRIEPTIHLDTFPDWGASSDDGRRVAVVRWHVGIRVLEVFDGRSGKLLHTYEEATMRSVSIIAERWLVAGTSDGVYTIYDLDTFEPISALAGNFGTGVVIGNADGSLAALVGDDSSLSLYSMPSGVQIGDTIRIPDDEVSTAAMRPDGKELAYGGENGHPFTVLDLDPQHWVTAACDVAGRNLTQAEWDANIGDLAPYHRTCPQYD